MTKNEASQDITATNTTPPLHTPPIPPIERQLNKPNKNNDNSIVEKITSPPPPPKPPIPETPQELTTKEIEAREKAIKNLLEKAAKRELSSNINNGQGGLGEDSNSVPYVPENRIEETPNDWSSEEISDDKSSSSEETEPSDYEDETAHLINSPLQKLGILGNNPHRPNFSSPRLLPPSSTIPEEFTKDETNVETKLKSSKSCLAMYLTEEKTTLSDPEIDNSSSYGDHREKVVLSYIYDQDSDSSTNQSPLLVNAVADNTPQPPPTSISTRAMVFVRAVMGLFSKNNKVSPGDGR